MPNSDDSPQAEGREEGPAQDAADERNDEAAGEEADEESRLREIFEEELRQIVADHGKWVETSGKEGREAFLIDANLKGANLKGANLRRANLKGAHLSDANLKEAHLSDANLQGANLRDANLQRADLTDANLSLANLQGANLRGANLQGARLHNANLQGARLTGANLRGVYLRGANLPGAHLRGANLQRAYLRDANLSGVHLRGANLRGANINNTNLQGADLRGANFRDADLSNADLTDVKSLVVGNLGGADLTNATLPEAMRGFLRLQYVEDSSKIVRPIYIFLLLFNLYAMMTILSTSDAALLTNSLSSLVPNVNTPIPTVSFYMITPILTFGIYMYFHFYLLGLWEALSNLPAIFPDGTPLDKVAYPWLLNSLVCAHFARLKGYRRPLSRLKVGVSIFLAWWVVPLTLLLFWARYLPRHDWTGTVVHLTLMVVCIGSAIVLYRLAARTLRRDERLRFRSRRQWLLPTVYHGAAALVIGTVFALVSFGAIEGKPQRSKSGLIVLEGGATWVPYAFDRVGLRTFANLREADVSTKPDNWRGKEEDIPLVKPASLAGVNLRYADAVKAFLAKADLRDANLQGAILQGANLEYANLQGAFVLNADLQGARLTGANLQGTRLQGANLRFAYGLTQEQLDQACGDEATKLPKGLSIKPCKAPISER